MIRSYSSSLGREISTNGGSGSRFTWSRLCRHCTTNVTRALIVLSAVSSVCVRCVDAQPLFTPPVSQQHCVCLARQSGWTINCAAPAPILAAAKYLQDNEATCSTASSFDSTTTTSGSTTSISSCAENYSMIQSHRDFCPRGTLPKSSNVDVLKLIDKYEKVYDACYIPRRFDSRAAACPSINCADARSLVDAVHTLYNECSATCNLDRCKSAFWSLLSARDVCPEASSLPGTVETALRDFQEHCEEWACNSARAPYDMNAVNCEDLTLQRQRAIDDVARRRKEEKNKVRTFVIAGVSAAGFCVLVAAVVAAVVMRARRNAAAAVLTATNPLADNRPFHEIP